MPVVRAKLRASFLSFAKRIGRPRYDHARATPPAKLQFAEIGTYNDHRMAMCFSLVALSDTPVTILDPKCTAKTFPDYFEQLARISTLA